MKVAAPSLAPILRSDTQSRLVARLFTDPERAYSLSQLVEWAGSSLPTVQREVRRAEDAGILSSEKTGPTRLVRVQPEHPLHDAVRRIVLAIYGPPAVVAHEFQDLDSVDAVLLFGSWAARYLGEPGRAPNDVDVLVIGSPDPDAVDDAADRAERKVGLPVQAAVRSRSQWTGQRDSFVQEVKRRPLVLVLGRVPE
jgi:hypothetical protein